VDRALSSFVENGIPILTTSTSCSLALKHEYRAVLGLEDEGFLQLAQGTWDIFEFLLDRFVDRLARAQLNPERRVILYHAPCRNSSPHPSAS
jgi:Fe-S oxidoreductase